MEGDMRKLIDDPRFQDYHRGLETRFNTFDVLRYSDYEIRHSNVLAWLLRPADTHGIGARFLKWFVNHVSERLAVANAEPLPAVGLEASNVAVERERHHVDITVLLEKERCVIAIENKTGAASPEHVDQVRGYERKLRGEYKDHTVTSVLLTTSSDGSADFPGLAHVAWDSVHDTIKRFLAAGEFHSHDVQAFVRQYLAMVRRWLRSTGGAGFKALLDEHRSILKRMRQILEKDGDDAVRDKVPEDRADYRDAFVRLVKESRQDPKQLRRAAANYLKQQGWEADLTHNQQGNYWVNWNNQELAELARRLGCRGSLSWGMTFTHRGVRAGFYLYQRAGEVHALDRLKEAMRATSINRRKPAGYVMRDNGSGWYQIFDQELLSNDELAEMSRHEVQDEVIRRLKDFVGSDESEYSRIVDYLRCLAFRPDDSASTEGGSR